MNNFRAGLYSFVSTTTWLCQLGMASPPSLAMLGLTLPNSRILSGIAGIGLTLADIALILPHLRQPILDSMHANQLELIHKPDIQEEMDTAQPVDLEFECSVGSPFDREYQRASLTCSATIKSICSANTEPLDCLNIAPYSLPLPARNTDDGQIPPQINRLPDVDSIEKLVSAHHSLMHQGRSALHIPLPVPDAAEVAFFDTTGTFLSNPDLENVSAAYDQYTVREEDSTIKKGKLDVEGSHSPNTPWHAEIGEHLPDVAMPVTDENVAPTAPIITVRDRDHHNPVQGGTISRLPSGLVARRDTPQATQAVRSMAEGKEDLAKRRPESLKFIPQSVVRRYPSAPMTRRCFGHRAFSFGHDHQPDSLFYNLTMQPGSSIPRAYYTPSEGRWGTAFLTKVEPNTRSMGGQTLVIETVPAQDPFINGIGSLPEPTTVHELTPLKKYPTRKRGLGMLARAALRDRRSAARRCRSSGIDGSFTSDSDSDSDNDSRYSGSSTDESMLPHILGADLIAAINANSESELNLVDARRTVRTPLDMYRDFLPSEDSAADVSMIMHVSSNDDTSDGDVKAPVTLRSLTYEDIQQWASGVVQRCVRQVCRSRIPVEPSLSPSQASDVCAERPSGSGISQCPLSGLHCKHGVVALAQVSASRTKEPAVSILPTRKPLSVRNVHDIPEFVPRQRYVSVIRGQAECPWRPSTRAAIDVTRDAATEVIARMESQAGFNTRQSLVGVDETRRVGTVCGF